MVWASVLPGEHLQGLLQSCALQQGINEMLTMQSRLLP